VGPPKHRRWEGPPRAGLAHAVLYDAAHLYPDADCPCIHRLADLTPWLDGIGGQA
jgi:hypothetical protein